jgi:malonate decarboxylase beta subunit
MTNMNDQKIAPSFIELNARKRIFELLDNESMKELLSPFERFTSPWLEKQGIVPQFDDGVVVAKGEIDNKPVIIAAIDGSFQGGSMGEVGGAKIAGSLELAIEDNRRGIPTAAVLLLETGGVRLQEANLGLAAIAEIHSAIVELRRYQPVIALVTGPVGCFGGMSITAALCSYLLITREGRLGLNGPQVIEQEAGIREYDSRDRPFIWSITGGQQRHAIGMVDSFLDDDISFIKHSVIEHLALGIPQEFRSDAIDSSLSRLLSVDTTAQLDADITRKIMTQGVPL